MSTAKPSRSLPLHFILCLFVGLSIALHQPLAAQTTPAPAAAQQPQVRYLTENGIRYMETRTKVQQPVREFKYVDVPQTVYMQRFRTDMVNQTSTNYQANTRYDCVPRLYDWWRVAGVFGQPYVAYGMEPSTTYQPMTQTQRVPVTRREVKQQTQMAKVAVPYVKMVEREQVSRVAVGPATGAASNNTVAIGGARPERYPGQPQQPTYIPVNGDNRQAGNAVATNASTIDPYDDNPFGSWGVGNRRHWIESSGNGVQEDPLLGRLGSRNLLGNGGNENPEKRAGVWPLGSDQVGLANRNAANRNVYADGGFGLNGQGDGLGPYGGTARFDGDFPRYGTGTNHQPTFQARRQ